MCVTVQGLPIAADAEVKARVEEVVADLKVKVEGAGCKPNIQILFSDQPQALMDKVFAGNCRPGGGEDGLTRSDVAYLTALYKTDLQARKGGQQTDIAGRMADMLLKAAAH